MSESEIETPEATARALSLVHACLAYSGGEEEPGAYSDLLAHAVADVRHDEWETLKTFHGLARIAYVAVKLAASNSLRSDEEMLATVAEAIEAEG